MDPLTANICSVSRHSLRGTLQLNQHLNRLRLGCQQCNFLACATNNEFDLYGTPHLGQYEGPNLQCSRVNESDHSSVSDSLALDEHRVRASDFQNIRGRQYHNSSSEAIRAGRRQSGPLCENHSLCSCFFYDYEAINHLRWHSSRTPFGSSDIASSDRVDPSNLNSTVLTPQSRDTNHTAYLNWVFSEHDGMVRCSECTLDAEVNSESGQSESCNIKTIAMNTPLYRSVLCLNLEAIDSEDENSNMLGHEVVPACENHLDEPIIEPESDIVDESLDSVNTPVQYVSVIHYAGHPNLDSSPSNLRANDDYPITSNIERNSYYIGMFVDCNNNVESGSDDKHSVPVSGPREEGKNSEFLHLKGTFHRVTSLQSHLHHSISKEKCADQIRKLKYTRLLYAFHNLLPCKFYKFPHSMTMLLIQPVNSPLVYEKRDLVRQTHDRPSEIQITGEVLKNALELQTFPFQNLDDADLDDNIYSQDRGAIGMYLVKPISIRRASRVKFLHIYRAEPLWVGSDLRLFFTKLDFEQSVMTDCRHGIFEIAPIPHWFGCALGKQEQYQVKCLEKEKPFILLFKKLNTYSKNQNDHTVSSRTNFIVPPYKIFDDLSDDDKKNTILLVERENGFENVGQEPIQIIFKKLGIQGYPFLVSTVEDESPHCVSQTTPMEYDCDAVVEGSNSEKKESNKEKIADVTENVKSFAPEKPIILSKQLRETSEKKGDNLNQERSKVMDLCDKLKKVLKMKGSHIHQETPSVLCSKLSKIIQNTPQSVAKAFFCLKISLDNKELQVLEKLCKKSSMDVYEIVQTYLKVRSNCIGKFTKTAAYRKMQRKILRKKKVLSRSEKIRTNKRRIFQLHEMISICYDITPEKDPELDKKRSSVSGRVFKETDHESISGNAAVYQEAKLQNWKKPHRSEPLLKSGSVSMTGLDPSLNIVLPKESPNEKRFEPEAEIEASEDSNERPPVLKAETNMSLNNLPFSEWSDVKPPVLVAETIHSDTGTICSKCDDSFKFNDFKGPVGNVNEVDVLNSLHKECDQEVKTSFMVLSGGEGNTLHVQNGTDIHGATPAQDIFNENVSLSKTDDSDVKSAVKFLQEPILSNAPSRSHLCDTKTLVRNICTDKVSDILTNPSMYETKAPIRVLQDEDLSSKPGTLHVDVSETDLKVQNKELDFENMSKPVEHQIFTGKKLKKDVADAIPNFSDCDVKRHIEASLEESSSNASSVLNLCDIRIPIANIIERNIPEVLSETDAFYLHNQDVSLSMVPSKSNLTNRQIPIENDPSNISFIGENNSFGNPHEGSVANSSLKLDNFSIEVQSKDCSEDYIHQKAPGNSDQNNDPCKLKLRSRRDILDDPVVKEYLSLKATTSSAIFSRRKRISAEGMHFVHDVHLKGGRGAEDGHELQGIKTLSIDQYMERKSTVMKTLKRWQSKGNQISHSHKKTEKNRKGKTDVLNFFSQKCKSCQQTFLKHTGPGQKCPKAPTRQEKVQKTYIDRDCLLNISHLASSKVTREDEDALEALVAAEGVCLYSPRKPQDPRPHWCKNVDVIPESTCQGDLLLSNANADFTLKSSVESTFKSLEHGIENDARAPDSSELSESIECLPRIEHNVSHNLNLKYHSETQRFYSSHNLSSSFMDKMGSTGHVMPLSTNDTFLTTTSESKKRGWDEACVSEASADGYDNTPEKKKRLLEDSALPLKSVTTGLDCLSVCCGDEEAKETESASYWDGPYSPSSPLATFNFGKGFQDQKEVNEVNDMFSPASPVFD